MTTAPQPAPLSRRIHSLQSQRVQLPALCLLAALIPLALVGLTSYLTASNSLQASAEQELQVANGLLKERLVDFCRAARITRHVQHNVFQ